MGSKARLSEAQIQKSIVEALSYLARKYRFIFHSIPNEAWHSRSRAEGAKRMAHLKAMGLTPGAADLLIIHKGKAHYLEVKRPGEKQSAAQLMFEDRAKECGATYTVLCDADLVVPYLKFVKIIPS